MTQGHFFTRMAVVAFVLALCSPFAAAAHSLPPDYLLSCENGRSYPIHARAVTVDGDLVTGYLYTGHHHATHIRLVPMGAGYRYIARGVWLDGWREDAELNFGKHHELACTVTHG
jgi:hypothetical protein